jgi:DNA-binding MarR family transcriptional regulator
LAQVGAAEGIMQQELADSLLVTKGNVCQLLDRLEGRGLILRRREGRTNRLFLTDKGRRLCNEVVPAHETLVAERFSALSPKEQTQLHELLRKLDKSLG